MRLKELLGKRDAALEEVLENAFQHNKWFTPENSRYALEQLCARFLNREKLTAWFARYDIPFSRPHPKTVGLVMAGNLPLVGFHDLLCVLVSGHHARIRQSSKDHILLPWILKRWAETDPDIVSRLVVAEQLKGMEAVIATGGDNAGRYFEYYFGKYPHFFRGSRGSVAVLTGTETREELHALGADCFRYFGLGCRNVSKLFIPRGYRLEPLFEGLEGWAHLGEHSKYKNNFDYRLTLFLLNRTPHLHNQFVILTEQPEVVSPVAVLHYEYYDEPAGLQRRLQEQQEQIQCVVGHAYMPFGTTQQPELADYADGADTLQWLLSL